MNLLFSFQGRIGRAQYWLTTFGVIAFYVVIFMALGISISVESPATPPKPSIAVALIIIATMIAGVWINLAALVRRYHDRNKSGWWFFIGFIPFIGIIWQFVELGFLSGTPGGNDYGVRGQSQSDWGRPDDEDGYKSNNGNLDDLIQQRLQERQQHTPAVQRTSSVGNLQNDKPIFGRRT